MHIPDGFIDGPTSVGAGVIAVGGIGVCVRRAGQVLDEKRVPLAGLTAAFIFAGQMLNFPVASGTSGHLLGGVPASLASRRSKANPQIPLYPLLARHLRADTAA